MGRWMKANGESIWGTQASPFAKTPWGRCTQKLTDGGATLYLHVFQWPSDGQLLVPGLRNKVAGAYLLADAGKKALTTEAVESGVCVQVPSAAPDPICSVVVLQVAGDLEIEGTLPAQQPDGTLQLPAIGATCHGQQIRYESGPERDNIGFWLDSSEWVEWTVKITKPGKFAVSAEIAATGSGSFRVVVGDQSLSAQAPNTGDYGRFQKVDVGELGIDQTGKISVAVKAVPEGWQPFNLKSLTLRPAK
jgi:alpha-L-fucosidase